MLASELNVIRRDDNRARVRHWTAFQCADDRLLERLEADSTRWPAKLESPTARIDMFKAFRDYAWQWY